MFAAALTAGCVKKEIIQEEEPKIHPSLSMTREDLLRTTEKLPEEIREKIGARPEYFTDLVVRFISGDEGLYRLVDKNNSLPPDYAPQDRVRVDLIRDISSKQGITLRKILFPDLAVMNMAMKLEGLKLVVSSAYRSYEYQGEVYKRNVAELGEEEANRVSAKPGQSQHQLGLTIDFGSITPEFADTPEGRWLKDQAWEYGFSLSYPEGMEELTGYNYEPWHFRYLGRTGTRLEKEFFLGNQQLLLLFIRDKGELFPTEPKSEIR